MKNTTLKLISAIVTFAFIFTQCGIGMAAPTNQEKSQSDFSQSCEAHTSSTLYKGEAGKVGQNLRTMQQDAEGIGTGITEDLQKRGSKADAKGRNLALIAVGTVAATLAGLGIHNMAQNNAAPLQNPQGIVQIAVEEQEMHLVDVVNLRTGDEVMASVNHNKFPGKTFRVWGNNGKELILRPIDAVYLAEAYQKELELKVEYNDFRSDKWQIISTPETRAKARQLSAAGTGSASVNAAGAEELKRRTGKLLQVMGSTIKPVNEGLKSILNIVRSIKVNEELPDLIVGLESLRDAIEGYSEREYFYELKSEGAYLDQTKEKIIMAQRIQGAESAAAQPVEASVASGVLSVPQAQVDTRGAAKAATGMNTETRILTVIEAQAWMRGIFAQSVPMMVSFVGPDRNSLYEIFDQTKDLTVEEAVARIESIGATGEVTWSYNQEKNQLVISAAAAQPAGETGVEARADGGRASLTSIGLRSLLEQRNDALGEGRDTTELDTQIRNARGSVDAGARMDTLDRQREGASGGRAAGANGTYNNLRLRISTSISKLENLQLTLGELRKIEKTTIRGIRKDLRDAEKILTPENFAELTSSLEGLEQLAASKLAAAQPAESAKVPLLNDTIKTGLTILADFVATAVISDIASGGVVFDYNPSVNDGKFEQIVRQNISEIIRSYDYMTDLESRGGNVTNLRSTDLGPALTGEFCDALRLREDIYVFALKHYFGTNAKLAALVDKPKVGENGLVRSGFDGSMIDLFVNGAAAAQSAGETGVEARADGDTQPAIRGSVRDIMGYIHKQHEEGKAKSVEAFYIGGMGIKSRVFWPITIEGNAQRIFAQLTGIRRQAKVSLEAGLSEDGGIVWVQPSRNFANSAAQADEPASADARGAVGELPDVVRLMPIGGNSVLEEQISSIVGILGDENGLGQARQAISLYLHGSIDSVSAISALRGEDKILFEDQAASILLNAYNQLEAAAQPAIGLIQQTPEGLKKAWPIIIKEMPPELLQKIYAPGGEPVISYLTPERVVTIRDGFEAAIAQSHASNTPAATVMASRNPLDARQVQPAGKAAAKVAKKSLLVVTDDMQTAQQEMSQMASADTETFAGRQINYTDVALMSVTAINELLEEARKQEQIVVLRIFNADILNQIKGSLGSLEYDDVSGLAGQALTDKIREICA